MNKNEATQLAEKFFKSYPSVNEFHFTADGQAFEMKHAADAHSIHLDKKEPVVITVARDEAGKKAVAPAEQTDEEKAAAATAAAEKAAAKKAAAAKAAAEKAAKAKAPAKK